MIQAIMVILLGLVGLMVDLVFNGAKWTALSYVAVGVTALGGAMLAVAYGDR